MTITPLNKYNARTVAAQSLVCVGLDSDIQRLPAQFLDDPDPQYAFNRWIIEQTHPYTSAYKLNTAFYEAQGTTGWESLKRTVDYLKEHHPDILTICDAKRADIGNTNTGYVHAIFDWLGFDAITLHPYLGKVALEPFLARSDKGCIILCRTSNTGAEELQSLGNPPLWQQVLMHVRDDWNDNQNCMLVVGATTPDDLRTARQLAPELTFLVPGVGAQGGDASTVIQAGRDANGRGLIVNSSRGIIFADDPAAAARELRDVLNNG